MPLRLPARPLLYRRTLILLVHIALIPLAYLAAFGLRFDFQIPPQEFAHFQTTVWYLLGIRLIVFWAGGLYRGYWKHVGLRDLVDLGLAVTISSAAFVAALSLLGLLRGMPRSVFLLDWVVMIFFSGGIRFAARALRESRLARARLDDGRRTFIIGAGEGGEQLLRQLLHDPRAGMNVVGFVDDKRETHGRTLHGVPVLGHTGQLRALVGRHQVELLVIAIRGAAAEQTRRIVDRCRETGIEFKIIPSIDDLLAGRATIGQLRDVEIDDLLGREPVTGADFYDHAHARKAINDLTKRYGLALDPDARMGDLPVGLQQRAEIVKVLYRGAGILILDEPTGVLTPQETKELFVVLRDLVKSGKTIIFISHKLKEVLDISDRITVMRRGKVVGHLTTRDTSEEEIATLMVGRAVLLRVDKKPAKPGAVVLKVEDVSANSDRGVPALKGVTFELRQGEILGIAGVEGNGQSELMEVIAGTRRSTGGHILLGDRDITTYDARTERDAGVAFIPEDRRGTGLVLSFSIAENSILGRERSLTFSWNELVLKLVAIRDWARKLVKEFDIRTPSIDVAARNLSGGNQQKVIVAREMGSKPKVLLAAQPTRGVDIGAIEFIHRRIVQERDGGTAVLLVSAELDEVRSLSDRIAVMYEGKIVSIESPDTPEERLGLLMTGGGKAREGAA